MPIELIQVHTETFNSPNKPANTSAPSPLHAKTQTAFDRFLDNLEETVFGSLNNFLIGSMYTIMFLGEVIQAIGLAIHSLIKLPVNFVRSLTK